ncbi:uncharacterized protein LOC110049722 [Orbicella faveolata]|uniref:uncharacterized protein LOC110049722 n=1 Tax=Orbicella faveolata TaxID=48498 RepID=UPI0009E3BE9B|nr:uncharacterized protein LOC110049722 [Orbicella faveolata]
MKNHILSGRFPLNNMISDLSLTTLAGTKLHIKKLTNGQVVVNGVAHVIGDIPATNGLVHVIDQMIPAVAPPPSTTVTPTKPTEPTKPTTATPGKPTSKQTTQQTTIPTEGPVVPDGPNAGKQESSSVGRGAIAGIIIGTIMLVMLIAFALWFVKKNHFPSRAYYKKNVDTVHFSNEAFNDNSMMSFDNVLYGNLDDPVLMTPLEFPIDDKQPVPQGQAPEHLDFDNPLYRDLLGLDATQNPHDMEQGSNPVSDLFTSKNGWIHAKLVLLCSNIVFKLYSIWSITITTRASR